jgi:hypothetical protein
MNRKHPRGTPVTQSTGSCGQLSDFMPGSSPGGKAMHPVWSNAPTI